MTLLLLLQLASAGLEIQPAPVIETETAVLVTREDGSAIGGATVRGIVHPGNHDEHEVAIGVTDARGRVLWTPDTSGRVTIRAGDQERDVLVAWKSAPTGVAMMLALLFLLGAASIGRSLTSR